VTERAGIKSDNGPVAAGCLTTTMTAGWICSSSIRALDSRLDATAVSATAICVSTAILSISRGCPTTLYRNRRDGTFEDVTAQAGIASHIGRGMSVAFADYDNDGFTDVFVTNDNLPTSCSQST